MPSQFEKYRFTKKTVLSDETFNKIFKDIDLRITALEDIKKDWTGAVEAVTRYGLQRIEEVLRPNWEHINNKKTEADNLVAQIQQKRDNADAIINTSRDDVLQQIQTEKIQALNNIQASRTDAITAIQNAKTSALTEIQTAKNNALPQLDILAKAFQNDDPTTFIVKRALQSDTALNANTASSAQNADKVDGYHASQTPAPNTIPVAGDNGKISIGWLNASQTPAPNTIPVAGDNGKISIGWLNASQTPAPNTIPVAGDNGKISIGWLNASQTPAPNTIPVAGDNGKISIGWLNASQTPAPNTIPVAGDNGKISIDWLPLGIGSNLNADKVDGFHASQTPTANTIPVADNSGKLLRDWIPSIFNSVVAFSPSPTIYLIMVVSQMLYGLVLSPNGGTWYGVFGQDIYSGWGGGGVITFYVPKGWYWRFSYIEGATNSGFSSYSWLKFVFNF